MGTMFIAFITGPPSLATVGGAGWGAGYVVLGAPLPKGAGGAASGTPASGVASGGRTGVESTVLAPASPVPSLVAATVALPPHASDERAMTHEASTMQGFRC